MLGPTTFRFLNRTESITDRGWDNPALEKLWRYNLHYFDDLNAVDARARSGWHRTLLQRWIVENPPGTETGWEPYPTSLRIVNWIKWVLGGNELSPECIQSLAVQTRWLAGRLETHLLGNHLLANAKALVFAGLFFQGAEAEDWLGKGTRLLEREIPEQILPDGGHFERSTMYHVLALEDILDLCNAAATFGGGTSLMQESTSACRARVGPMRRWLAAMSHPDGEISFFNDAAIGIAPSPGEIDEYATRLGFEPLVPLVDGLTQLSESGYVRLAGGDAVVIVDVAPIGPDYLPAHAHADTLSFELSLFGERVLVNSGTSLYDGGDERLRQRGTAAHNTVVIDGENSSEVWGNFRVARRARPLDLSTTPKHPVTVRCSHDGYARLQGSPQHTRAVMLTDDTLLIEDQISGEFREAEARFHLCPAVRIEETKSDANGKPTLTLKLVEGQKVQITFENGLMKQEATSWHPAFGECVPTTCLVNEFSAAIVRVRINWSAT